MGAETVQLRRRKKKNGLESGCGARSGRKATASNAHTCLKLKTQAQFERISPNFTEFFTQKQRAQATRFIAFNGTGRIHGFS